MKKFLLSYLVVILSLFSVPAFAQADQDTAMLGLAGDNLDLYAVLTLFQKSKTIELFEKSLNEEKGINNLDLNLDKKVDFIKVTTKQKDSSFSFILQVDISKTETQDVAVILVDKLKNKKVSLQIVGDELLYGKDYVIEPKGNSPVTPNPGYAGPDPVPVNVVVAPPTTIVVEQAPIVQYVYSPAYVPYVPPFYYGFYPPYFAFGMCIAVGIYRANTWGYHGGYHGGHNNVIINNNNNFNNYNNNKSRSNTVNDNMARGNYGDGRGANGNRGDGNRGNGSRGGPSASTRPANGAGGGAGANRPSTGGPSASTRPSTGADRPGISGGGASASTRPTTNNSPSTRQSSATSSRTRSGGGGGGFSGGGGGRGGGGGGGRRR